MTTGRVILVGAGPGDPELLTLKAARILREARVVLHDDLVSPGVLALIGSDARRVAVGKRGGCPSTPQAFIAQLMIREARAGHDVVRLKGGDPFVFGRGGEELAVLREAGIVVEVVPGLTAGLVAPALVGIPVTHRDCAHGVALITGHPAPGAAEPDWRALAQSGLTLVIYMGMKRMPQLQQQLLQAGIAGSMPVAVIERASQPEQTTLTSTLEGLVDDAALHAIGSPAIIVVGAVAALAQCAALTGDVAAPPMQSLQRPGPRTPRQSRAA